MSQAFLYRSHLDELVFSAFDNLTAVYDRFSGQTHILTEVSVEILRVAGVKALCKSDIVGEILANFDVEAEDDPRATLIANINELDDLGLLRPVL